MSVFKERNVIYCCEYDNFLVTIQNDSFVNLETTNFSVYFC